MLFYRLKNILFYGVILAMSALVVTKITKMLPPFSQEIFVQKADVTVSDHLSSPDLITTDNNVDQASADSAELQALKEEIEDKLVVLHRAEENIMRLIRQNEALAESLREESAQITPQTTVEDEDTDTVIIEMDSLDD